MESKPQPSVSNEQKATDPRKKEGMGLDYWAGALLKQGLISQEEFKEFIEKNNSKEKVMEESGFPQLGHYGLFNSIDEIRQKLSTHIGERFIIRCAHKETGDIKRLIDTDLEGVSKFAAELPGGFGVWNVEVKEFVTTKAAGTIVVEPTGRVSIETWLGPHYLNTENISKYHAEFDPEQFDQHFRWRTSEDTEHLPEMQEYAFKALRYIFPYLSPKQDQSMYVEYGVKKNGEVYFIEANDSPIVTGGIKKELK